MKITAMTNTRLFAETRLLVIDAVQVVDTCTEMKDREIEGKYEVEIPSYLSDAKAASVALDHFLAENAIGCPDDFEFCVLNEQGREIQQDSDHEIYSGLNIPVTVLGKYDDYFRESA